MAGIRASLHTKLMAAFGVVTVLFVAMAAFGVYTVLKTTEQARLLDEAHQRVGWSQEVEQALARQMQFSVLALLSKDEAAIARILRENNRFNELLARLDAGEMADQHGLVEQVRVSQDEAMGVVADIANAIRDRTLGSVTSELLAHQERLDAEIGARVGKLVAAEQRRMATLRDNIASANRELLVTTGVLAVSAVVLAWLCGFVISWSVILPVRQAQGFLDHVATGAFDRRVDLPNRDEFGALAERMNRMSEELRRLDRMKVAAASELAQLNAILGFTEMIADGLYGEMPEELKDPLNDIQVNGRHLLRLINEVLDLAKIEAGRMELALDDYSVAELVGSVRTAMRSLAEEKGLTFLTEVADDLPTARGDSSRLTQCLMNLTGNALKFTRVGEVRIGASREGDAIVYRVSDTGIGIPEQEIDNVFGEFRQVDATVTREFGGTGLGLSITKKFIEMHGGRIWVESWLGLGSTFFFSVPLRVGESA